MIGILIAIVFAALVYALCIALGLPSIIAIVAALLVLLAGVPYGGWGWPDGPWRGPRGPRGGGV